jgi:polysaccharide export outer membrane protein
MGSSPSRAERVGTLQGKIAWQGTSLLPSSARQPASARRPEMDDGAVTGITDQQQEQLESYENEYRLGSGDVIELFSYNNQPVSREYMIGPDGMFSIPVHGVVNVKGLTRTEAEQKIEDLMSVDYRHPEVTLLIKEYNNNRVYVLGEVGKPGVFNFQGEPMLLGALAQAQGVTEKADMRECTIIRGRDTLIVVDLYALLREGNRTLNLRLKPEDTVYVRENEENVFYVLGEVKNPGVYPIKRRMDAVRGIALAGGPTEDGAKHKTRILRRNGSEIQVFDFRDLLRGDGDGTLVDIQPRDIVFVPRKHIATFNYALGELSPVISTIILGTALAGAL